MHAFKLFKYHVNRSWRKKIQQTLSDWWHFSQPIPPWGNTLSTCLCLLRYIDLDDFTKAATTQWGFPIFSRFGGRGMKSNIAILLLGFRNTEVIWDVCTSTD